MPLASSFPPPFSSNLGLPKSLPSTGSTATPSTQDGCDSVHSQETVGFRYLQGDVRTSFRSLQPLQTGGMSDGVRAAEPWFGGDAVAVKRILCAGKTPKQVAEVQYEILIHSALRHPNIATLHKAYENDDEFSLVMELLEGGDLLDLVEREGRLTEVQAATLIRQALLALEYLHDSGVMHLDIKPENFVFAEKSRKTLKLIDFGLSARDGDQLQAGVGTSQYMALEVARGNTYDSKADLWSLGVVVHVLLTGRFPTTTTLFARRPQDLTADSLSHLSLPAKDFLKSLLAVDTRTRLDAKAALQHPWLLAHAQDEMPPVSKPWFQRLGQSLMDMCS